MSLKCYHIDGDDIPAYASPTTLVPNDVGTGIRQLSIISDINVPFVLHFGDEELICPAATSFVLDFHANDLEVGCAILVSQVSGGSAGSSTTGISVLALGD